MLLQITISNKQLCARTIREAFDHVPNNIIRVEGAWSKAS